MRTGLWLAQAAKGTDDDAPSSAPAEASLTPRGEARDSF